MKILLLAFIALLLLAEQQCQDSNYAKQLQKKWVHSYEEDSADVQAYRPAGYNFPPSRGRRGLEFKADGSFIRYEIAPSDGELPIPGTWEALKEKKVLHIQQQGSQPQTYDLEIVALSDTLLKVKKRGKQAD